MTVFNPIIRTFWKLLITTIKIIINKMLRLISVVATRLLYLLLRSTMIIIKSMIIFIVKVILFKQPLMQFSRYFARIKTNKCQKITISSTSCKILVTVSIFYKAKGYYSSFIATVCSVLLMNMHFIYKLYTYWIK
jgi:hypothetical protein